MTRKGTFLEVLDLQRGYGKLLKEAIASHDEKGTLQQLELLELLSRGQLTQAVIADALGITVSTSSRNQALLEERGLIETAPSKDKRSGSGRQPQWTALTRKGRSWVQKTRTAFEKATAATATK